jgi:hypothetical protein
VQMTTGTSTGLCMAFHGVPDWVKVVATEDADGGSCTVTVQPFNG